MDTEKKQQKVNNKWEMKKRKRINIKKTRKEKPARTDKHGIIQKIFRRDKKNFK